MNTDGDFIIYAINKQADSFIVLNDVLSRLPREMQFILNLMPVIDVKFFIGGTSILKSTKYKNTLRNNNVAIVIDELEARRSSSYQWN